MDTENDGEEHRHKFGEATYGVREYMKIIKAERSSYQPGVGTRWIYAGFRSTDVHIRYQ